MNAFQLFLQSVESKAAIGGGGTLTNVALAANGASIIASSSAGAGFPASSIIDGHRVTVFDDKYWSNVGGYSSDSNAPPPQRVEITFAQVYPIELIHIFTLADAVQYSTEPTLDDITTQFGILDFTVEYWTGSAWAIAQTVTDNNKVWRQFAANNSTNKIAVDMTAYRAGAARLVEVEAFAQI